MNEYTTNEYTMDDDQDHEANAAYYDQLAQEQSAPTPAEKPEPPENQHLRLARQYMEQYEHRINQDNWYGDLESRTRYEDAAYKQSMMHAAYAQAEAATRQAEVAESFLEFVAEFVDKTDLIDALSNWEIRQR